MGRREFYSDSDSLNAYMYMYEYVRISENADVQKNMRGLLQRRHEESSIHKISTFNTKYKGKVVPSSVSKSLKCIIVTISYSNTLNKKIWLVSIRGISLPVNMTNGYKA